MNNTFYWWSCYARFKPGEGVLPHMGEVIAEYRQKRGFKTQTDLAIAAGVTPRLVTEWETKAMLRDPERRILLAKLLKIPPALLGLDWRTVFYTDNTGTFQNWPESSTDIWLEDSYYHYEDTLAMTWDLIYNGHFTQIVHRFERRLNKLESVARNVTGPEKEAWLTLLCQYYQTAVQTPQHHLDINASKFLALQRCQTAISIAKEIEDSELLASAYFRLAGIYETYGEHQLARENALAALQYIEQIRDPIKGNVYLRVSSIAAHFSDNDQKLITEIRNWQDKALNIVQRGNLEPDRSFVRLNYAAVHHERAKTLLKFYQATPAEKKLLRDAQSEMKLAWNALPSDISAWQMYFFNTEARLYLAERDLEGSARLALESLQAARKSQSQKGEKQVRDLLLELQQHDSSNPYVCRLGLQLGVF